MNLTSKSILAIFAIVLIAASVGFYFLGTMSASQPEAGGFRLPAEIPIGAIHASDADLAISQPGIDLGIEDLNKYLNESGIPVKFTVTVQNAQESATKAVEALQTLIAKGVKFVIGSQWSSQCKAMLTLAEERDIVLFSPASAAMNLAVAGDNLFRMSPTVAAQAAVYRRIFVNDGIKAVVVVHQDDDYTVSLWEAGKALFNESGIEIFGPLQVASGKTDYIVEFSDVNQKYLDALAKYQRSEVAVWLVSTGYSDDVAMLHAVANYPELMKAVNRTYDVDHGLGAPIEQYAAETATELGFVAIGGAAINPNFNAWRPRYVAKTGFEPPKDAYMAYDIVWVGALSILVSEECSGTAIAEQIPTIAEKYYGVSGWTILNAAGDRDLKGTVMGVYKVINSKWEMVGYWDGMTDSITWY